MIDLTLNGTEIGHEIQMHPDDQKGCKVYAFYSGSPIMIHVDRRELQRLSDYLDMENVDPYDTRNENMGLRVVQEADGRTWVRVWHETGVGRLVLLPDEETGRLYDWLSDLLS